MFILSLGLIMVFRVVKVWVFKVDCVFILIMRKIFLD